MFPEVTRDDVFRLETQRLWLRWPRAADAAAIARLAGDPDIALNSTHIPHPYEIHHADAFIVSARAENAAGAGLVLALTFKRQPKEPIGMVGLHGAPDRGEAMFGFWLGKPFWGQGLMTEAAAAFTDLVFGVTSLGRIASAALPTNAASWRVHEKLGFLPLGRSVVSAPARGGDVAVERFELRRAAAPTPFGARRPRVTSA
ncbi:MAG: GNAT family N-acetyltransferase [Methylocystis sp.]|nr:GNAT family N-acetyltransferase [Methylocystis sp.]MBI3275089.1 GNAT family N-acetyltransferase [Methylocystis sp.]